MAEHDHQWRWIEGSSCPEYDYYNCNCGAFARVFIDPHTQKPCVSEAFNNQKKRIKVDPKILFNAKNKEFESRSGWIIR